MTDKRIGNQFWKMRAKHGRKKIFETPEIMWESACEYFQWCEENPLYETKAFHNQGEVVMAEIPLMRAMTISGLCIFFDINSDYFTDFKDGLPEGEEDFSRVIKNIYEVVKTQKFEGAAAGLLNSNIIARDLGLKDRVEQENTGSITNTNINMSKSEYKELRQEMLDKDDC